MCASYAIIEADKQLNVLDGHDHMAYIRAMKYIRNFLGARALTTFNDMYTTTRDDIFMLLKNAATLAEREND